VDVKTIRAALAADPEVGAGNALAKVLAHGADPDGPGLCFDVEVDGHPAWSPLTLGELDERVRARAAWLHAHGIRPRDPVAIYVSNAPDQLLNLMALARLGAIPAMVNGRLPGDTAAEYIRRLRAVGVLADERHRELLGHYDCGTPLLADVGEIVADPADAPVHFRHHADDPVAITHSSGTTGMPKAVVHSHGSLFAATRRLRLAMPRAHNIDRILSALPAAHAAGIVSTQQALCNRVEMLFLSAQSGAHVLGAIESFRPTAVYGFAVTWSELARFDLSQRELDSVSVWFNTGDCAHEAHVRPLVRVGSHLTATATGAVRVPGSQFVDGLGSTEMGHTMFHMTHGPDTDRYGRCIGRPHRFVEIAVLDEQGRELGVGEIGQLGIRSPTLTPGYWNDSVTTYRTRLGGYYLTGDVVYRDGEGYYYHLDRAVDSVDLGGGAWLYTAMSEERILRACPDVRDCTVVAVTENGRVSTDVLLLLRTDAKPDRDRSAEVAAALGEPVAATLRQVVAVPDDEIPAGPTGKVRKFALRERATATVHSEHVAHEARA
jgi:acyl-coenzyme A synthetase/AMP-(fatty) acid ligase